VVRPMDIFAKSCLKFEGYQVKPSNGHPLKVREERIEALAFHHLGYSLNI